jgi:hypothetical protein
MSRQGAEAFLLKRLPLVRRHLADTDGDMENDRLRVPVRFEYASALGLAVYCFASLEWNAVWCCERIRAGSVENLSDRTAGRVADTLIHLVGTLGRSEEQVELSRAATDFRALVGTRNNLVHAKPATAANGEQALFRHGDQWTLYELEAVADAFTACSLRLNDALHGLLSR